MYVVYTQEYDIMNLNGLFRSQKDAEKYVSQLLGDNQPIEDSDLHIEWIEITEHWDL